MKNDPISLNLCFSCFGPGKISFLEEVSNFSGKPSIVSPIEKIKTNTRPKRYLEPEKQSHSGQLFIGAPPSPHRESCVYQDVSGARNQVRCYQRTLNGSLGHWVTRLILPPPLPPKGGGGQPKLTEYALQTN